MHFASKVDYFPFGFSKEKANTTQAKKFHTAVELVEQCVVFGHSFGLPWWSSIVLTTLAARQVSLVVALAVDVV